MNIVENGRRSQVAGRWSLVAGPVTSIARHCTATSQTTLSDETIAQYMFEHVRWTTGSLQLSLSLSLSLSLCSTTPPHVEQHQSAILDINLRYVKQVITRPPHHVIMSTNHVCHSIAARCVDLSHVLTNHHMTYTIQLHRRITC